MPDTKQQTSPLTLADEWKAAKPKSGAPISLELKHFTPHAEAVLFGYQAKPLESALLTQVLGYDPSGIFKVGVFDDKADTWHFFLMREDARTMQSRYVGKRDGRHYHMHNSVSLPEGEDLKALGMAKVRSDKSTEFRRDMHWSTMASIIGVRRLVQLSPAKTLNWSYLVQGFAPVRLVRGETLPDRFLQYIPDVENNVFVVEVQAVISKFSHKMLVYRKDNLWRTQSLARIRETFSS